MPGVFSYRELKDSASISISFDFSPPDVRYGRQMKMDYSWQQSTQCVRRWKQFCSGLHLACYHCTNFI